VIAKPEGRQLLRTNLFLNELLCDTHVHGGFRKLFELFAGKTAAKARFLWIGMGKNPFGLAPRLLVGMRRACLTSVLSVAEPENAVGDMRTCNRTVPCSVIDRSRVSE
jgi:hypothetical protein